MGRDARRRSAVARAVPRGADRVECPRVGRAGRARLARPRGVRGARRAGLRVWPSWRWSSRSSAWLRSRAVPARRRSRRPRIDRWAPGLGARELLEPLVDGIDGRGGRAPSTPAAGRVWLGAGGGRTSFVAALPVDGGERWCVVDRDEVDVTELRRASIRRGACASRRARRVDRARIRCSRADAARSDASPPCCAAPRRSGCAAWCVDTAAAYARGPGAVRPADRPVPGGEAPLRRHARRRSRRPGPRCGTRPGARRRRRPAGARAWRAAPRRARARRRRSGAPRTASRCSAASATRGSTTPTSTSSGPPRCASSCRRPRRSARRGRRGCAAGERTRARGRAAARGRAGARARSRAFVAELTRRPTVRVERASLAESGYLVPHWPTPWGLDADPVEQLVIDEELRRRARPPAAPAGRRLGAADDHRPRHRTSSRSGWSRRRCAARSRGARCSASRAPAATWPRSPPRATRVDGGWSITGQKVWTTMADARPTGRICLARTDPDAPQHEGIGCFLVDMTTPGIDIRPLRELTGMAMFNEVFLDDVFVPDDCVVGAADRRVGVRPHHARQRAGVDGARARRSGPGVAALFDLAERRGRGRTTPLVRRPLGGLVVDAHADRRCSACGPRCGRSAAGQPGPEASVRKLLGVEHEQDVQEVGPRAARPGRRGRRGRRRGVDRRLPRQPGAVHRRRHERDPAQRDRRTPARPPQGPVTAGSVSGSDGYRPSGSDTERARLARLSG